MHLSLWAFPHGFLKLNLFSHVCMASTALAEDPKPWKRFVLSVSVIGERSDAGPIVFLCRYHMDHRPHHHCPLLTLPFYCPDLEYPPLAFMHTYFGESPIGPQPTLLHSCRIPRLSAAPCTMQSCRHRVMNLREPHSGGCDQNPKKPAFLLFLFKHNGDGGPVEPISPHINQS